MADTSIYRNMLGPVKSVADYDNAFALQKQNQIGLQEKINALATHERDLADERANRAAFSTSGGDAAAYRQNLIKTGNARAVQAFDESQQKLLKGVSDIGHVDAQTLQQKALAGKTSTEDMGLKASQHADRLSTVADPSGAVQWLIDGKANGSMNEQQFQMGLQNVMKASQDPAMFSQWKTEAQLGARKFAEMNKPSIHMQDTKDASNVVSVPGMGGVPTVLSRTPYGDPPAKPEAGAKPHYDAERGGIVDMSTGAFTPVTNNGVPVGPKVKDDKRATAAYQAGLKEIAKDDAQMASVNELEGAYKRWVELNAKTTTGPIAGYRPISFDNDFQEMKKIENWLAINNFKPGQGQISNFERTLIKGGGVNTLNDVLTNKNIVDIQLGGIANMKDRANFKEAYLQQHGNLLGSEKLWQDYLEKNPRYTRDQAGQITPNPKRVEWIDHFGGGADIPDKPPTAPKGKTMSMDDVNATAKASGKTPQQVMEAAKQRGYTVK